MLDVHACRRLVTVVAMIMSMTFYVAYAPDPPPLQNFCVGVVNSSLPVSTNGLFCKNSSEVTSNDFLFHGFNTPGNTNNRYGSQPRMVNVGLFPALNTLGVSMGRGDFAPGGVNPLHFHPRASEMLTVLQGTLYVGFVSSDLEGGVNTLYSAVLNPGDIFVFPQALVHFQWNIGDTYAVSNTAFGSQNPGRIAVADTVFGTMPIIPDPVLTRTFQVNESVIQALRSQFSSFDGNVEFKCI